MISIRELHPQENNLYQAFFQKGLMEDSDNFRITTGDPAVFPSTASPFSFTLGAFIQDELAGVVSFEREGGNREKLRHKGMLIRMLVGKEHRGAGVGKKLIGSLIARVKKLPEIEQINLTVAAHNVSAKHLYASFGFETYGLEKKAIKWNDQYFDEAFMTLHLV